MRGELGYADYLGALERYRLEALHNPKVLQMAPWLVDYPFADRIYPGAFEAVQHVKRWGDPVILSDGDAVFQPVKVDRSGLRRAFEDRVLIYVHKEQELLDVERWYPARRYVMVDDKLRILAAIKEDLARQGDDRFRAPGPLRPRRRRAGGLAARRPGDRADRRSHELRFRRLAPIRARRP